MVRVEVVRVVLQERHAEQVVWLRECDGTREFPIVTGVFEAAIIDRVLKGARHERPLTHDLLAAVVAQLDAELVSVLIDDVQEGVFFAKLELKTSSGERRQLDARPSDAIALALKLDVSIHVTDMVMNAACTA